MARTGHRLQASGEAATGSAAAEEVAPAARPRRAEALARLDSEWGPLPVESLDWARERLDVSGRSTDR